jgi:hypothetical protein
MCNVYMELNLVFDVGSYILEFEISSLIKTKRFKNWKEPSLNPHSENLPKKEKNVKIATRGSL